LPATLRTSGERHEHATAEEARTALAPEHGAAAEGHHLRRVLVEQALELLRLELPEGDLSFVAKDLGDALADPGDEPGVQVDGLRVQATRDLDRHGRLARAHHAREEYPAFHRRPS